MNLDTFAITSVIVHNVPAGAQDPEDELILVDAPIIFDEALRSYFRRKILKSLGLRGLDVVVDSDQSGVVRDAVATILADADALVAQSKLIAEHLHDVQTGRNSSGLLAVVLGVVDGQTCVSVLKLEREEGLHFTIKNEQGHRVVDLELLRELTLTDKTKVFKTSMLMLGTAGAVESMFGRVSDDQRGKDDGVGVATFYLSTFLGCRLKTSPEKATMDFVKAAESFFNANVANAEKRGRYQVALLSRMQDNVIDLRPRDFAQANLESADRPGFNQAVRDAGLDPNVAFEKDTSLVKVNGFKMTFENGMVLVGTRSDLEERVKIRGPHSDSPGVEVIDGVKRLGGR